MDFKDYYATLGVPKTATDAEIKRAYRKLARKLHPDLNPGDKTAEAGFKELNEAHEVLSNPESRKKYDELGSNWRQYENTPPPGHAQQGWSAPFDPSGGGATYRTVTPEEMQDILGTNDPFSDFFHTFFGGRTPGGRARRSGARTHQAASAAARGGDIDHPIELTLEEAFRGTSRHLVIKGDGAERSLEVRIPAGVKNGARVRAAGGGAAAPAGGSAGDLFLKVQLLPHATFERRDQDLYTHVKIPVTIAVLGGEAEVPTLAGSTLRLRVPELTASGRVFRLRGHGMPAVGRPDERGDLYATVEVELPSRMTDEARKHWEALRSLKD